MSSNTKYWFAIYCKPRWEKKVYARLEQRGLEAYCPLNKVQKKWSDRYKVIEEPLFKSYLFVRVGKEDMGEVRFVDGVVNFVYWLGKPAIIRDEEIEKIKRFLNEYEEVSVEAIENLQVGTNVIITSGVFMDQPAKVVSDRNKTVILEIDSLGCRLVAEVPKDKVVPVGRTGK